MTDRLDAIAAGLRDGRYDCRVPGDTDDVRWLVAEVRRLRETLTEIAHHPHQSYDHPENGAAPYGTGCADGHRCAANIALAALKGEGR